MALAIYRSNRLDVLATVLAELLRQPASAPADPFRPLRVIVGSRGMERWLRHQLAVHLGICAHVEFPFPRQLVDELLGHVETDDGDPPADPWRSGALTWRVLQVLQDLPPALEDDLWAPVRAYLDGASATVDARQHALALMLGDLVDRYVTYRPDLARAWSAGVPAPVRDLPLRDGTGSDRGLPGALRWQPALWQRLVQRLDGAPHVAERLVQARAAYESGPQPVLDQPIRLFGLSTLPPAWVGLLASVARHHRVELYLSCPSDQWWGDLRSRRSDAATFRGLDRDQVSEALAPAGASLHPEGNPLLLSLGRVARDLQIVLESLDDSYTDEDLNLFVHDKAPFADPAGPSGGRALQRIQSDVVGLVHPSVREPVPLDPHDDSIQLHSCYGPTRQVEALRETLLGLFEAHRDLEARDVVVMTPDIEAYAPLISAVFDQGAYGRRQKDGKPIPGGDGWGPAGSPRIPYEIADLSVRRLNPVADAVLRVLELASARVTASGVLDLARLEPVRARFGLAADELERLGELIRGAGARWGLDAQDRQEHDQPADRQNTWIDALDRLWLGVAMPDAGGLYEGMVPVDDVEGGDVDLVGRFGELAAVVLGAVRELKQPRTVAEWVIRVRRLVSQLTATPGQAAWLTRRALEALEGLEEEAAAVDLEVSVQAFTAALSGRFDVAAGGLRPQTGAVTFCALTPMRTLPYRVVCLLGMDEDAFPGKSSQAAFDLTMLAPRVGDRDRRDEDRLLLLEAILAAQDHLLVFYSGHDVLTDEDLPPCVPVAELLDTVVATFSADGGAVRALTVDHPLQPFSPRTFVPPVSGAPWHRRPYSFDRRLAAGARITPDDATTPFWTGSPAAPDPAETVVTLAELVDFLDHPARFFFRQALGVSLWDGVVAVDDREPIEVPERPVIQRLVQAALAAPNADGLADGLAAAVARLRGEAVLPLGAAGDFASAPLRRLAAGFRGAAAPWLQGEGRHADLDVVLDGGLRLVGRVHDLREGDLFSLLPIKDGSGRPWWSMEALVGLLAWQAASPGHRRRAVLLYGYLDGDTPKRQWRLLRPPDTIDDPWSDARERLARLVRLMVDARQTPPRLFGASADALVRALDKHGDPPAGGWLGGAWPPEDAAAVAGVRQGTIDAFKAWEGGYNPGEWDGSPYLSRIYTDGRPPWVDPSTGLVTRAFADAALAQWGTALAWRQLLRKPPSPTGWGTL